ncbi:matrix remodeling-associated protein 8 [Falco biarmicus]|uniref:matrix remodeling-associated protein 8 n=1 Tax=Falco peregrinus TaxID=8954 RepID=UPI0003871B10|nr:matrix remodeling-associated protein 8 [Falco peregrinus]XP_005437849.1 matrix remodeling-associated protein 8 [Falco cherrug]XP_037234747.1 matrix remodeling-associated protein 8 [Falco rusticolus]XP_056189159.1 matrix remodeling-associated protein 8 [Falco biarmicus]
MKQLAKLLLWQILLQQSSVYLYSVPADASNPDSVVVSVLNISATLGSQAVLPCKSYRMVWTQDRLNDRQRVVHWDVYSNYYGDNKMERLCDMYSAGDQRVYSSYNQGRIFMPQNAFTDGNFSLVIKDVAESDEGTYSCNLHHHYCHLYETVKIQLAITKKAEDANEYWDGEKPVIVALEGSTVMLPCVNRNHIWTERHSEEEQQVVHWDRQPPGVPHDRADRLIDLYASGERRSYGPLFIRQKMNITDTAFALGDFSLRISELESADEGTYSCHLHHHYCGLHERRIYQVFVTEPVREKKVVNLTTHNIAPAIDPNVVRGHNVINVIIPESRMHFFQQLGYILATLLLFIVLLIIVILVTRKRRQRGYEYNVKKYGEKDVNLKEFTVDTTDLTQYKSEDIRLDYKNNILKEKAEQARSFPAKNIDLDKDFRKEYCK